MWKIFTLEIPLAVELRKKKADGRKTEATDVAIEDAAEVHVIRGTVVEGMQTEEKKEEEARKNEINATRHSFQHLWVRTHIDIGIF